MQLGPDDTGRRFERNLAGRSRDLVREPRETTRAIPAHFRFTAVGVVIPHPKVRSIGRLLQQQNAVCAHPAMSVANARDLLPG